MNIGRLVLTYREDLIPVIKDFYLPHKTSFLVIAYDRLSVDPQRFEESDNFRLVPYDTDPIIKLDGQQFRVWTNVIKMFTEVEAWIVHDYDMVVKPTNQEIMSYIGENQYAMIGTSFPVWVEGMEEAYDTYPFPQGHKFWGVGQDLVTPFRALIDAYPTVVGEIKTYYGGYGDFLAARSEYFLLMEEHPLLARVTSGGNEMVPHTVWKAHGIKPVDMTRYYRTKIFVDGRYIAPRFLHSRFDFMHSMKFWPGTKKPSWRDRYFNAKRTAKSIVKRLIRYEGWGWRNTRFGGAKKPFS